MSHFTKPRPNQRGLYAVNRPEPESLLLTVGKLKKLVGQENVGIPVLLNQRVAEPFTIDVDTIPDVSGSNQVPSSRLGRIAVRRSYASPSAVPLSSAATPPLRGMASEEVWRASPARQASPHCEAAEPQDRSVIAFTWYRPSVQAEVLVREGRLVYIKTRHFAGHVIEYSGVWKGNAKWWDRPWRILEWDIEVENQGVYRLCKGGEEWFVMGEYD
jgi:hypothetical protein